MKCPYCRNSSLLIPSNQPWYLLLIRPVLQKAYCYCCSSSVAVRGTLLFGWKLPIGASHVVMEERKANAPVAQANPVTATGRTLAQTMHELRANHSQQELERIAHLLLGRRRFQLRPENDANKASQGERGDSCSVVSTTQLRRKSVCFTRTEADNKSFDASHRRRSPDQKNRQRRNGKN